MVTRRGLELDLLAVAHALVGALAVDLDRADGGRHLVDLADEARSSAVADRLVGDVRRSGASR